MTSHRTRGFAVLSVAVGLAIVVAIGGGSRRSPPGGVAGARIRAADDLTARLRSEEPALRARLLAATTEPTAPGGIAKSGGWPDLGWVCSNPRIGGATSGPSSRWRAWFRARRRGPRTERWIPASWIATWSRLPAGSGSHPPSHRSTVALTRCSPVAFLCCPTRCRCWFWQRSSTTRGRAPPHAP